MFFVLLLTTSLFSTFAFGMRCEPVDLRDRLGPILNQDEVGWCYAYTAADLVSFKLKQRVSPIDIAAIHHRKNDHDDAKSLALAFGRGSELGTGGIASSAILDSQEAGGFCDEKSINANDLSSSTELNEALKDLNSTSLTNFGKENISYDDCVKLERAKKLFPGVSVDEIQELAKREYIINLVSAVSDKACNPRIMPNPPFKTKNLVNYSEKIKNVLPMTRNQFSEVDRVISSGKPISIGIFMERFYDFGGAPNKHAKHAMTIVGKRFNPETGECEYIVRNSWGPECSARYKATVSCENGTLFISEKELRKAVYSADYIE